jgi:hypothetical protein
VGYKSNFAGIGQMLKSNFMMEAMAMKAEKVRAKAEDIAPVYTGESELSPPGSYKRSFKIIITKRGGKNNDRAEAAVISDSPVAKFVEHGTTKMAGEHILLRALMEGLAENK